MNTSKVSISDDKIIYISDQEKLVNVMLVDGEIWYLTRPRNFDEKPISYLLRKNNQIKITIKEC